MIDGEDTSCLYVGKSSINQSIRNTWTDMLRIAFLRVQRIGKEVVTQDPLLQSNPPLQIWQELVIYDGDDDDNDVILK